MTERDYSCDFCEIMARSGDSIEWVFPAGGGCGRPVTIRIMPPMSTMTARSITMATMSTMIMIVFAPHYSQYGVKPAVSTAVGVGSKGIGFPLDESRENIYRRGMLMPKCFRILTGNGGCSQAPFPASDEVLK